jgi:hypothetical protein
MGSEGNTPKNLELTFGFSFTTCSSTSDFFFGLEFLNTEQSDKTRASAYSDDMAKAEFFLFPPLKSGLRGQNFCDATGRIKNAAEELQRLSQNGFQDCFQHL